MINKIVDNDFWVTDRYLAKITGNIVSFSESFGSVCRIMTRQLHLTICFRRSWDTVLKQNKESIVEFNFLRLNCMNLPFKKTFHNYVLPERLIYTDASDRSGAGFCTEILWKIVRRTWTKSEAKRGSTWRELKAIEVTLDMFKVEFQGKNVKVYTDNQNAVRIIEVGSMKSDLHNVAFAIFKICMLSRISLEVCWIPRNVNVIADFFSKMYDADDWGIDDRIFKLFNRKWGPFTCDLFANSSNFIVKKFYSKFVDGVSTGIDAFSFDWKFDNNWIVPPVRLISKVIYHLFACKATGVLVAPKWTYSPFWSSIVNNDGTFKDVVKECVEFKEASRFFVRGSQRNSVFPEKNVVFNVVVLRLDAR